MSNLACDLMVLVFVLVFLLVFLAGCASEKVKQETNDKNASYIPKAAKNVESLGDGWFVFDIEIRGTQKTILFHRTDGHSRWSTESMTELVSP